MITSIRVTSREEAQTAIKMLTAYLAAYGEEAQVEKAPTKTASKPKTAVKTEKASEPTEKKETVKKAATTKKATTVKKEEATTSEITLEAITTKAKEVRGATDTATVKAIIANFTTGKISTIKEEDYPKFMEALESAVA